MTRPEEQAGWVLRDYVSWLRHYDEPDSPLSWRLRQVQGWLRAELDVREGPVRVVSACAGDGRDIIDVLAGREDAGRVTVTLLEADPRVAELARQRAAQLPGVTVRESDAGATSSYVGAVPADLVLLVGVLGNISAGDLAATVAALPQLCAPDATLIWSRGRDREDLNDRVRADLRTAGFADLGYVAFDQLTKPAVGRARYDGPPVGLAPDRHLFTFWR